MKTIVSNVLLVAVILLWVVGVDYYPIMRVLGVPLVIVAVWLWVNWGGMSRRLMEEWRDE